MGVDTVGVNSGVVTRLDVLSEVVHGGYLRIGGLGFHVGSDVKFGEELCIVESLEIEIVAFERMIMYPLLEPFPHWSSEVNFIAGTTASHSSDFLALSIELVEQPFKEKVSTTITQA